MPGRVALLVVGLLLPWAGWAQSPPPLSGEARLARIERLVDSGVLLELANRLEQLQGELQQLRGEVELQRRDLDQLKQRQRDLYVDIDGRLRRIETGGGAATATTPPPAGPADASIPGAATPPAGISTTEPPHPPDPTAPGVATATVDPTAVQRSYQEAFERLKEGRYEASITAFQQYLASYPGSAFADNAQYWLGEANYVTRNFETAVTEFRKVLSDHAGSPKVPDAMLKLGYAYYELQNWSAARATLTDLRTRHPNSTAARLAASRLQRMAQEGR